MVISSYSALEKDDNCYPQVFLKDCQYAEKKVIRHYYYWFNNNLSDFSSDDDELDEE